MRAPLPLSRRTTITTVLLVPAGAAACDIGSPAEEPSTAPSTPPRDADSELVASVLAEVVRAESVIAAAAVAAPVLARPLELLATAHAAHRTLLAEAAPDAASDSPALADPPDGRAAALRAVRRSEATLQRTAIEACVDASSGDLARVLASLSASTSQHLAALDANAGRAS